MFCNVGVGVTRAAESSAVNLKVKKMKKKLAIISTFDDLCGIASYTRSIVRQLDDYYEINVFDLDQFIFKAKSKRIKYLADQEVKRICKLLPNFDAVNIQLEHGTLGNTPKEIMGRLLKFCRAAPRLSITFHTIIHGERSTTDVAPFLLKGKLRSAYNKFKSNIREGMLAEPLYKELRRLQKKKPVSVICHTKRDARSFRLVYGINNVYDHPLAFYRSAEVDVIRKEINLQQDFPLVSQEIGEGDVLLGCFGFFGTYKGLHTAIEALRLLPCNYKLAIFGGVHPNAIQKNELINPYVDSVLKMLHPGVKAYSHLQLGTQINLNSISDFEGFLNLKSNEDLSKRVFFAGALTDDEFPKAMAICNIVLLPYVEVGQSASGPMSMAVDVRANILASRTKAFMQFARYHPARFEMFEVGNFLQLSQQIQSFNLEDNRYANKVPQYTVETNVETYKKALFWEST